VRAGADRGVLQAVTRMEPTPSQRRDLSPLVRSGSFTSLWLLRSTVRMSASYPKANELLRSSEMPLSARNGREQMQQ